MDDFSLCLSSDSLNLPTLRYGCPPHLSDSEVSHQVAACVLTLWSRHVSSYCLGSNSAIKPALCTGRSLLPNTPPYYEHLPSLLLYHTVIKIELLIKEWENSIFKEQKKNKRIHSSLYMIQGPRDSFTQTLLTVITYSRVFIIQTPYTKFYIPRGKITLCMNYTVSSTIPVSNWLTASNTYFSIMFYLCVR